LSLSGPTYGYSHYVIPLIDDMADIADLTASLVPDPRALIGIPLALIGAVFLSFGAQYQHRGVAKVEASSNGANSGLSGAQLGALIKRPSWVLGTVMLGLAIVLQLTALNFAPLIVVQPLGAVALVITTILNARISKVRLNRKSVQAVIACVAGVGLFVALAASFAVEKPITDHELITILWILLVVLIAAAVSFGTLRKRFKAIYYILCAGIIYGFVATLAKVIINRIQNGNFEWLTVLCVIGLLVATALGAYFVQNAYSSGPPDLVVAGLTVIDPMVAVGIGIIVLGEASQAPLWAAIGFVIAGAIAVWGVFQLARHHPGITK